MEALARKTILGVAVTDASKESVLQYITKSLEISGDPYYIVTPNPEIVVAAKQNPSFRLTLNQARVALPDGIGVVIAARLLGRPLKEKISGVDFMENLCADVADLNASNIKKPITVGFLGGRDGVANKTAECLLAQHPGLQVVFVAEEWSEVGFDFAAKKYELRVKYEEEKKHKKETISHKPYAIREIDILFVAFGFPKQELWMAEHLGKIPVKVMMGVGGAFDYLSGSVPRAPLLLRVIGLEWLFRLIIQPWRWKRQLSLILFFILVGKEFFTRSKEV